MRRYDTAEDLGLLFRDMILYAVHAPSGSRASLARPTPPSGALGAAPYLERGAGSELIPGSDPYFAVCE